MTYEQIDKIMKPYWIEKFSGCVLDERYIDSSINIWYGLYNEKGELVIGTLKNCPTWDLDVWYYDGKFFSYHNTFFDLTISEFNQSMKRYLIKTYNLKIKNVL
jgi:hypothetical protein